MAEAIQIMVRKLKKNQFFLKSSRYFFVHNHPFFYNSYVIIHKKKPSFQCKMYIKYKNSNRIGKIVYVFQKEKKKTCLKKRNQNPKIVDSENDMFLLHLS